MCEKSASKQNTNPDGSKVYPQITVHRSPFDGLSQEEVDDLLKKLGEDAESQFNQTFATLNQLLLQTDPLCLLSWLSFYGLARLGNEREIELENRIWQHEVELVQALSLQHDRSSFREWNFRLTEQIHSLAKTSQASFEMQQLSNQDSNLSAEKRAKLLAIELMRANTQIIRNWGYPNQVANICTTLLKPLDDHVEAQWRIRTEHLIEMFLNIIVAARNRSRAHFQRLHVVLAADSIDSLVDNFCTIFSNLGNEPADLLLVFKKHQTSLDEAKK